jgi:hypothetical protein
MSEFVELLIHQFEFLDFSKYLNLLLLQEASIDLDGWIPISESV